MASNSKGLTLLEIMAATVILGLVVLTFVSISQYKLLADHSTDLRVEAMRIAQNHLHAARAALMDTNKSLPPDQQVTGDKNQPYKVHCHVVELDPTGMSYSPIPNGSRQISLQSVIMHNSKPSVLTVTVSWGQS